jgi:hypothetical protein
MAPFSWFYFVRFCTSAPHTNLLLTFLDILLFLVRTRTFLVHWARTSLCKTIGGYVTCRSPHRFFRRFFGRFLLCIANTPTQILMQNFQVLLQLLPHDRLKPDATVARTLNP